jgi:hypothetical protein
MSGVHETFLRKREVSRRVGLAVPTIYRKIAEGHFHGPSGCPSAHPHGRRQRSRVGSRLGSPSATRGNTGPPEMHNAPPARLLARRAYGRRFRRISTREDSPLSPLPQAHSTAPELPRTCGGRHELSHFLESGPSSTGCHGPGTVDAEIRVTIWRLALRWLAP